MLGVSFRTLPNNMEFIRNFEQLDKDDVVFAGGKGTSLGEMKKAGVSVPPGFVILSSAFEKFLEETDLNVEIDSILDSVDHKEMHTIEGASEKIKALILQAEMPKDIAKEIQKFFKKLNVKYVAVRSSATAEDSASAAWAGQLESYLNTTEENLLENVKRCWASLFTPRAIFYSFEKNLDKSKISVAVVVQKMVESEKSGVAFSVHPVTQDRNQLVIEAGFGLGEAIVSGQVTPDSYVVEKEPRRIIDKNVQTQLRGLYRAEKGGSEWRDIPENQGEKQVLSDKEILELSDIIIRIEKHYNFPCDIEWATEKGKFYIVQSRPITTLSDKVRKQSIYKKIFTRDFSLPMLQVWYKGEAYDKKPWSNKQQEFLPYIVFVREDDTVKSYYDPRGVEWIKNHIKESIRLDKNFLNKLEREVNKKLKSIQPIYEKELSLSKKELLDFIKNFEIAYPWVEAMWWLCEMSDEELGNLDISSIKKLRERTTKLSAGTDVVVRKSIMKIFPKIKNFVHVLTIKEIETENFPKLKELKARDKGFIFTQNRLSVGKSVEDIEKEYNILLEREKIGENIDEIKGVVAYPGIVRGKVRRVMGHKQIYSIKKNEILVSPMTMPDFLPAMKKAVAFVTDEGGMTCHAAIVAREMKKPCVVGTKNATKILKDGDLVEVNANNGIVRILK
jgi:phosphoenolpyruvate synthase/pyruvate phosphate dikinase